MIRNLLLSYFCFGILAANAQKIEFETTTFDFGKIKEVDGPVEHEFIFTNTGSEPLVVSGVKPSCGCTTTGFTTDTVYPGDKGYVKAMFNPHNRPGTFNKSLTVNTNAEQNALMLNFTGFVVAKQRTFEEELPIVVGGLRLSTEALSFGKVTTTGKHEMSIKLYNTGSRPIKVFVKDVPTYLRTEISEAVEPGSYGMINFLYEPAKKNQYGLVSDQVQIITDEVENNKKVITVSADIHDAVLEIAEDEKDKLQRIDLSLYSIEFDSIRSGQTVHQEFEIRNSGKQELIIRHLRSDVNYILVDQEKRSLKPGQKIKVKVSYNAAGRLGKDAKLLYIYSNDPSVPVLEMPVRANVFKKEK